MKGEMIKLSIFAVVSAALIYISRASLRAPRSHGFYRFFAWECILALALLNAQDWFRDPFSVRQLISWLLLISSVFLVVEGAYRLRRSGKPGSRKADNAPELDFEKTTVLVTGGIFKYIRHPLYSSLLFLAWGTFLKAPSPVGGLLAGGATLFLLAAAKIEERENIRYFGAAYQRYMKRTRLFIPFLF